jgi:hypothetical protein
MKRTTKKDGPQDKRCYKPKFQGINSFIAGGASQYDLSIG